jgi:apolipoprotein N-acyltransferase
LAAAFPKTSLWGLAWISLVPLLAIWRLDEAPWARVRSGMLFGVVFFSPTLSWLVETMRHYGGIPSWMGGLLIVLLAAWCSLFLIVVPFLASFAGRAGVPAWLAFPAAFTLGEYLRGVVFTGFPWALLGYSQMPALPLVQIAEIGGVWIVSFSVVLVNSLLAEALLAARDGGMRRIVIPTGAAGAVVLASFLYGISRMEDLPTRPSGLVVGIVQPAIPQDVKWDAAFRSETVERLLSLTRRAADAGAGLVLWPEAALPFYFQNGGPLASRVPDLARERRIWLLFGTPGYERDGRDPSIRNRAYLMGPDGSLAGLYDKVHLTPYGEYVPLKRLMPFVDKMVPVIGDMDPGTSVAPLPFPGTPLGTVICYEDIFPSLVRSAVRSGAAVIAVITNDAWFGSRAGPFQHWEMSRLRAVEHRLPLVRSANTGISGIVDPAGRITVSLPLMARDAIVAPVPASPGERTLYTRLGDWFPLAAAMPVLLGLASGLWRKRLRP